MGLSGVFARRQAKKIDESLLLDRAVFARVARSSRANVVLREIERHERAVLLTTNNEPVLDGAPERGLAAAAASGGEPREARLAKMTSKP